MITLKPGRNVEVLLSPAYMEQFTDEPVNEGWRLGTPLPLEQVLKNVEQLHERCNGHHVCGLPIHLQRFDLISYLKLARASK
jgi:hypothetical protein